MTSIVNVINTISVLLLLLARVNSTEKMILHLGVLISQEGDVNLSGYIPSMNLALEGIKNDTTLPFDFHVYINDSMCDDLAATRGFIDQVTSTEDQIIMMIGADCSVSTEPVGELTPHWNIVQISPSSVSPFLSNTQIFPSFLRTVPSEAGQVVGIVQAMKQFGWSRLGVITQSENLFTFTSVALRQVFAELDLQLLKEVIFNTEGGLVEAVETIRNSPARIIFLNMYSVNVAEVLCQAYKKDMFYPKYVWILYNWFRDRFWVNDNPSCIVDGSATPEDLERVLRTSITLEQWPAIDDEQVDERNVGNISWNQYLEEHDRRFRMLENVNNDTDPAIFESAFIFEALWTAALALNRTQTRLSERNLTLLDFTYDDEYNISDILYDEALNVTFLGLTGNVSFLPNGDRIGQPRLLQYRGDEKLEKILFARIIDGNFVYERGQSSSTVFPDEIPQDEEQIHISLPLFIVYTIIAIIGIALATVCLVLNLWFRKQKLVKLSSPYVNIMIIAGAVLFYLTVILFGVDENVLSYSKVDRLCQTRIWLVAIGFSLLYGTIFAKTWRIYYIFNHTKPNSKLEVKDVYLFAIVGILVAVDIVFLIPTTAVSRSRLRREYEEMEGDNANDLPQIIGVCTSEGSYVWLPVLFAYKGIILLVGLFLAFETRKVKIKSLNDSRFITMSVYGTVIVSVTLTPIGFLLQHFPNVQYGVIGIMILTSTSVILGLIFVTKWYKVYQDPEGTRCLEKIDDIDAANTQKAITNGTNDGFYKGRIMSLNEEIIDLNKTIKVLNDELAMVKDDQVGSTQALVLTNKGQ